MNLFPRQFIARHQGKLLFAVVWLHITMLNLFYVSYSGPVFFWSESAQLKTLAIHLFVSLMTLVFYFALRRFFPFARANQLALPLKSDSVNGLALENSDSKRQRS